MTAGLVHRAGSAVGWRAVQLGGVKLIYFLRLLLLARLLAPDDFGLLAVAVIALDVLLRVTDTGMIPALIQQPAPTPRHYDVAWTVGLVRSTIVAGAVVVAAPLVAAAFAEPRAVTLMRVLAVRAVLEASTSVRVADLQRTLRFRALATISLTEAAVNTAVSLALAPVVGVWALIWGPLAGAAAASAGSYASAPHRPRLLLDRATLGPLIRYGRWIFLTGLIAVAGTSLLQLVIARRLGVADLGLYFLAAKLAFLPSSTVSEIVGAVTFPVYARFQDNLALVRRAFRSLFAGIAAAVLPASLLLVVLAPSLVQTVLGPRWDGTVPMIRILAAVGLLGMVGDLIVPVLKGVGQPARVALLEGLQSALLVGGVWQLADGLGVMGAALAWVPAVTASQLVAIAMLRRIIARPFAQAARPLGGIAAASLAAAAAAWAVDATLSGIVGLAAAVLAGCVVAALGLWLADRRLRLALLEDLRRAFPQLAARRDG